MAYAECVLEESLDVDDALPDELDVVLVVDELLPDVLDAEELDPVEVDAEVLDAKGDEVVLAEVEDVPEATDEDVLVVGGAVAVTMV